MPEAKVRRFQANLVTLAGRIPWVILRLPFSVRSAWGKGGRLPVCGYINGHDFRSSLCPSRDGTHFLIVNKKMQAGARAKLGSTVRVRMQPDMAERVVTMPAELKRQLAGERALQRWFAGVNYSARKEICRVVAEGKTAATRQRRAEQMAELIMAAMEGERELPPILRQTFAEHPGAEQGWKRMSPSHRRAHLMGIFYYSRPESRARRVAKVVEDALQRWEKARSR